MKQSRPEPVTAAEMAAEVPCDVPGCDGRGPAALMWCNECGRNVCQAHDVESSPYMRLHRADLFAGSR